MNHSNQPRYLLLALLLLAGVMALTGCSSTPLPPLFISGGRSAAQPAAPAAPAVAATAAPTAAVTTPEAVAAAQPAPAAGITTTADLAAAAVVTDAVRAMEAITLSAPITSTGAITSERASDVAVVPTAPPAPTATRVAPTATRAAATATRAAPTATRVAPTATRAAPAATRAPARPAATPTPEWPKTLVITADEIEEGATSVPGLQVSGLDVQFGNGVMTMRFDSLRYSFVSLRNVTIEGRFVVNNCDVDFVADRITPRNLATGAIPGFINQSLDQQLGDWCVESVAVQPGQLAATVRPR